MSKVSIDDEMDHDWFNDTSERADDIRERGGPAFKEGDLVYVIDYTERGVGIVIKHYGSFFEDDNSLGVYDILIGDDVDQYCEEDLARA